MERKFTFLALLLFLQVVLSAQVQVQLGSGTLVTSNVGTSPANINFRSSRSQMVYTAAELNAAGAFAGNLLKLGFYIEEAPSYGLPDFSIKMKHTAASDVSVHDGGPFQEVYFNPSYTPTAGGFDLLTLNVPFLWNGTDNILIDVCFGLVQPDSDPSGRLRYYSVTNGYRFVRSNSQNMCSEITSSVNSLKPQLSLVFSNVVSNDAGVISLDAPGKFCLGLQEVVATIANYGDNAIDEVTVNWEFDGVIQAPVQYFTPIDTAGSGNNTAQIALGSKNFAAGQAHTIKVWTSEPNSFPDTENFNDTIEVVVSPGLSGAYTIGGANPDYNTFSEALADLQNLGVCGPATFNVRNGTYNEQLSFLEIPGVDTTNTITFQSELGDSSLVTLSFPGTGSANYTLQLDGADWLIFRKLSIEATNSIYGRAVVLRNGASHNRFENCELRSSVATNSSDNLAVVYSPGNAPPDEYNLFQHNYLRNGSYGFYWAGFNTTVLEQGNVMNDNRIENPYAMGGQYRYQQAMLAKGNDITSNSAYNTSKGIYGEYCDDNSRFLGNKIKGFHYGLQCWRCDGAPAGRVQIINNFVQTVGTSTGYGIYSHEGAYHLIAHNSVQVQNTAAASAAFYTDAGSNKIVLNNIFANYGGGYATYRNAANGLSQSDYNALFTTGSYLGHWDGDRENLADWQNASSMDVHSLSLDPLFLDPADFPIVQVSLDRAATPLSEAPTDIEGDLRDFQAPDIGADEFTLPVLDAGVVAVLPPEAPFSPGQQPILARIKNFGATTLTSLDIEWAHNGSPQTIVNWTGSLASGDTAVVNLGQLNLPVSQGNEIAAWSASPNGMADPVAFNDSSTVENVYAALSGTYTIGGASPDFASFTEAAANLNWGGVLGAVTFEARDATYNEQVILKEMPGASETNTVTFQSESGDSSLVRWIFSANTTNNYTLLLNGADWVRLKRLTLEATNSSYGRVLELRNGASNNSFENCKFQGQPVSSNLDRYSVIYSDANGQLDEYNAFRNNAILYGSYSIQLSGISNTSLERGIEITGNQIDSCFAFGILLSYVEAPLVRSNLLSSVSGYTGGIGIELENCAEGIQILKNQISGFQQVGVYLSNSNGTAADPIVVANNFVSIDGNSLAFGIESFGGSYQKVYHNSVSLTGAASTSFAFYSQGGTNKDLLNNIFVNNSGGYAIYTSSTASITSSDHNDLFTTGANLGYWNGNRTDLAAWRAASTLDSNSVSFPPAFVSATDLHLANTALDKTGGPTSEVSDDIDGEARDPAVPDIGADEIFTDALDASLVAIASPVPPFPPGLRNVWVRIGNNGTTTLTSLDLEWGVNGAGQATYNWTGSLPSGQVSDSINIGSFDFLPNTAYTLKVWTSNPNSGIDEEPANDTIIVSNLYPALVGFYTIGGASPDFLNFTEAANALIIGGVAGPVTFNVRNGAYNEQISLPEITGMGPSNTVTFQSEAGDSSLVALTHSSSSTDNYTVQLDGADWFVFKNLSIEAASPSYGRAFVLQNGASHNRVENCELRGNSTTGTSANLAVVYTSVGNTEDEYNIFRNTRIREGSYGFYLQGINTNVPGSGNIIENCYLENQAYRGIFLQYQDAIRVINNQFVKNPSPASSRGVDCIAILNGSEISGNQFTGFDQGINLSSCNGAPNAYIQISNNFIQTSGNNQTHSISSTSGSYQRLVHNTVRQLNTNVSSSTLYLSNAKNTVAYNNIWANEGGGYVVYGANGSELAQSDNNNFFTTGPILAYWNGDIENFADWQSATSLDGQSINLDPFFLSPDGYTVAQVSLNGNGSPFAGITEDIDGESRNASHPDIGCDEFTPPADDAGISAVIPPTSPFAQGLQPVSAVIKNYGDNNLSSATIDWTANGILQTPVNWTGAVASGDTAIVLLGTVDFAVKQEYEIRAWPSLPNGMADGVAVNDTSSVNGLYAALSGTYTIGGASPDFNTFTEAATNLNLGGVSGPVTFSVRDGTYNEQLVLSEVPGVEANKAITFQSESGDSSLVTLTYNANASNNYTVLLDGTDWIRLKNITLEAVNVSYGRTLELRNQAANNRFENCEFRSLSTIGGGTTTAVIYSAAGPNNNNVFVGNAVLNGGHGFYLLGENSSLLETGIVIENNRIENPFTRGIFAQYAEQLHIHSNRISTSSNNFSSEGVHLENGLEGTALTSNQVTGFRGTGIYLSNAEGSAAHPVLIANNFVQTPGTATGYGIYTINGAHQQFYHNSVHITNTSLSSAAFFTSQGSDKDVRNNIFANSGGGYAFYRNASTGLSISDYNALYTSGANIAYWDANQAALADWQAASGLDVHSIADNPFFIEADSFAVAQSSLNGAGTPLPEVVVDIEGDPRDAMQPDIGCDEFMPPPQDAGIAEVLPPPVPFASGQQMIQVKLKNFGADTLQSATLNWTLNGSPQPPVAWSGSILSGDTLVVDLNTADFAINQAYDIAAWASQPNGTTDPAPLNDSSSVAQVYAGLAGAYTLGGASPDFNTFGEAAANLNIGGVVGEVVFNIRAGTYNEQLLLTEIPGADSLHSVTFQSESGDSSSVVLSFDAGSTAVYTCRLDGTDWIKLKSMTLEALDPVYGTVLDFQNGANHNRFEYCEFRGVSTTSNSFNAAVIFSPINNDFPDEYNVFRHNLIRNGSYGIHLAGMSTAKEQGICIENNHIENSAYRGISGTHLEAPVLRGNLVATNSANTNTSGIYLNSCIKGLEVTKNQVFGFSETGISFISCSATDVTPGLVANNFIQLTGTAISQGLYNSGGSHHKFYHNTVHCINTNSGSAAFSTSGGSNLEIINNIFANTGGGYAINLPSAAAIKRSDHNDLFATGPLLGRFVSVGYADLAAWTAGSLLDSNSVSLDPIFAGSADLHVTNTALDKVGTFLPEVTDDIDGQPRNPVNPDCGADEFITDQVDAGVISIDSPSMPFTDGFQPVYISVVNFGMDTLVSATIDWEVNGIAQPTFNWADTLLSFEKADSVCIGNFLFNLGTSYEITAWSSNPNGVSDEDPASDTARVDGLYAALGGIYTIGGVNPDFTDFSGAVSALANGGVVDEVSFLARDGIYNEQLAISEIPGAGPARTVTFQSESGDSTAVKLSFSPSADSANYIVLLDGADWIRFERMTLENTSTSHGRVASLANGADNNRFSNNEIIGQPTSTPPYEERALAFSDAQNNDSTIILNNRFAGGAIGLHFSGKSPVEPEAGTWIEGNTFEDQYFNGIYLNVQDGPVVKGNKVTSNSTVSTHYAITCRYCENGLQIVGNVVNRSGGMVGIRIQNTESTAAQPGLIANNMISVSGLGTGQGIYIQNSTHQRVYHNNVRTNSNSNFTTGLYLRAGSDIRIINNVLVNLSNGYTLYNADIGSSTPLANIAQSDFNNLYSEGTNFAFLANTIYTTLFEWQNATGLDGNTLSIDPLFASDTDLHTSAPGLDGAAIPLAEVTEDVDGEARNPQAPDIGADEFTSSSTNDAGILALAHPSKFTPFAPGLQAVDVVIRNNGADTLTSATIRWTVNEVLQPDFSWTGFLEPGERDTVTIGQYNFQVKFAYDLLTYTRMPNGATDPVPANDSVFVEELYTGLQGVFTLGGALSDFVSFTEASIVLNEGGLIGPVAINVKNGNYREQLRLGEIKGSSAANTLTFQSESGDSSLVSLANNSLSTQYTIQLDGTSHITFRNLTLESGLTNSPNVFEIANGVSHVTLSNSRIIGPAYGSHNLVNSLGSSVDNNLTFQDNAFIGGRYGIKLRGQSTGSLEPGILIEGNSFVAQSAGAIEITLADAPVVRNNAIFGAGGNSNYYGMNLSNCDNAMEISGNKILNSNRYGLFLTYCDASIGAPGLVANNFIHTEGTEIDYNIYISECNFQNIYFNSLNAAGANAESRAFFIASGGNINLLNNILAASGGGYAIYTWNTNNLGASNNNDLYTTGPWLGRWAGTNADGLAAWQSISGKDNNSVSADPLFYSPTDLHALQIALDSTATPISGITEDIDGDLRQPNEPDIGADEFDYLEDDIGILALLSPASGCDRSSAEPVKVVIQNFGGLPQTGFDVSYSFNGGPLVTENVGALVVEPGDTAHYTFTPTVDVSAYTAYSFSLTAQLATDLNPGNDQIQATVQNVVAPGAVSNMLPAGGLMNVDPPVTFSWAPAAAASRYDLFVWHDTLPMPAEPVTANLDEISYYYTYGLVFGDTYKWQVVAKNDFCETSGPLQTFTVRELPDLEVSNVSVPGMPFSGQEIEVSWQVDNNGAGGTGADGWIDAIYLSADTTFQLFLDTYLGGFANLTTLNPGQMYTQTANVMLPDGIEGNYYIFVYADRYNAIKETDNSNNYGARGEMQVMITPPPDLQVASIITPNNAFSGQGIDVTWVVKNEGVGNMDPNITYLDRIYLSDEPVFNVGASTLLGSQMHTATLDAGASDTLTKTVTLPQGIFGDYYIHILADAEDDVFEYLFENNNTGTSDIVNVILTPPPDLVVASVAQPDSANNRELINIQWTVENAGGSDATGNWWDRIYVSTLDVFDPDSATLISSLFRVQQNLPPGGSYTAAQNLFIPINLGGPIYFYITTDANNDVFEFVYEDNNTGRNPNFLFVKNADLIVDSVGVPATADSGQPVAVQWAVKNNGPGDVVLITQTDKIFLSSSPVFDLLTATELGEAVYYLNQAANTSLIRQRTVTLPNGLSGDYYIHVVADFNDNVNEGLNENNNTNQAAISLTLPPWPDLQVTTLAGLPDSTIAGSRLTLTHTVENFGGSAVQSSGWKDKIYWSANPAWNPADAVLLKNISVLQPVGVGGTYTLTNDFDIPSLSSSMAAGVFYLYLFTDAEDDIFENTEEGNNIQRSGPIEVFSPPPVDFEVLNVTALPDTLYGGQNVNVQWMVRNIGTSTGVFDYLFWLDGVYLSTDTIWDAADLFVDNFIQSGPVGNNESYADNQFFMLPSGISGDYYALLVADDQDLTLDGNRVNNVKLLYPMSNPDGSGPVRTIHVISNPLPDLRADALTAPPDGLAGQPIEVQWQVTNAGDTSLTGRWTDRIFLSTDFQIDGTDRVIGTKVQNRTLAPGEFYQDTLVANIPSYSIGNYVLLFKTDVTNTVFEGSSEGNNQSFSYLTVAQALPSDLVVSSISAAPMAMVGDPFTIQYSVRNEGTNPATGVMKDLLYFSVDSVFDATDIRFTDPIARNINLAPQATSVNNITGGLPGLPLGAYYIVANTDILNNIAETNDNNNIGISTQKVMVTVPELPIGLPVTDTLPDEQNLYYRIEVPDTLLGETLLLSLSAQQVNSVNELYLSFGEIPTRSNHDFSFSDPFTADQEIVVPELDTGTYYLLVYGSTDGGNSEQEVELHAQIINFSIREIMADQGGNTGNVTVKLEGAKFTPDMAVRLEGAGLDTIVANYLSFVNSAKVFVTFPLGGAPLGTYNVVAQNLIGETATLDNGFEVVEGDVGTSTTGGDLGGDPVGGFYCNVVNTGTEQSLLQNLIHPEAVRINWVVPITIQFGNDGNVDIPCPTRWFASLQGAPLSFDPNDFSENDQKLFLEFRELGGPPGILRPGASSSITVYTFSSHPLLFILIN